MGKAGNQSIMEGVRGRIGCKVVFRQSYGETIACASPSKSGKAIEKVLAHREKFQIDIGH